MKSAFIAIILLFSLAAQAQTKSKPTVAEAEQFMKQAETRLNELSLKGNQATWVQSNFITEDTEALAADAIDEATAAPTDLAEQAKRFDGVTMPPDLARKFMLLRLLL